MQNIAVILIALLFSPVMVNAQINGVNGTNGFNSDQVTINVSATVNGSIELITIQTMDFQQVDRQNNIVEVDPIQSERAGKLVARGAPGTEFRLNYLPEREITNTTGVGLLMFYYNVAGNGIDEQETSELLGQEAREMRFNSDGEFYIWVGGRVDLNDAEPGSYEGEFTIEIEYI